MPRILPAKKSGEFGNQFPERFEGRLLFSILFTGVPGIVLSLLLLWYSGFSLDHKIEGSFLVLLLWLGLSASTRDNIVNSLRVLSNVISALKDEDFSFRATKASPGDALGELALEINNLSRALAEERLGAIETSSLLRKVMAEASTIIFAFSPDNRLRIVNRTGALFLGKREEEITNRTAEELGLTDLLEGPPSEVMSRATSGGERRWIVRRASFRQHGEPHRLVVLSEASEALRAEERMAWQRLIRVFSHEINNSLAPIRTIAGTLRRMLASTQLPPSISEQVSHGLEVIHDRSDSLGRFLQSYTRVARLAAPACHAVSLHALMRHVVSLEPRLNVKIIPGPDIFIYADPDQLEQALINLIKNAADAVLLASKDSIGPEAVTVSWNARSKDVEICIRDEGLGLQETENLFVPFYTTKEDGSGIGLFLSRQIVEAHKGTLTLTNRAGHTGCEAEIKLPMCIVEPPGLKRRLPEREKRA